LARSVCRPRFYPRRFWRQCREHDTGDQQSPGYLPLPARERPHHPDWRHVELHHRLPNSQIYRVFSKDQSKGYGELCSGVQGGRVAEIRLPDPL
ncbi:hypothetical protein H4R21_006722, partial [Coemansia helicoidea]